MAHGERTLSESGRSRGGSALRVGVVGTGALGRHHVRLLTDLPGAVLTGVYDVRREAASRVASETGARVFDSVDELAAESDAMVVAVPTACHADVGCPLLERGLHVLVEKPVASDLAQADRLLAATGDRVLAVGHVEFYNPAVQAMLAASPRPRFLEVQRLSVFTRRSLDIDVVLDLMIHDLQILQALDPSPVAEIRAVGVEVLSDRTDIANARVELTSGCVANVTASRVSNDRVRRLRLFSRERYLSLDYQRQTLRSYRLEDGAEDGAGDSLPDAVERMTRRIAAVEVSVKRAEPLRCELEAFVAACRGEDVAYVDGHRGRAALECALGVVEAVKRR